MHLLRVCGSVIHFMPERWNKMVAFVHVFADSVRNQLNATGGALVIKPTVH